MEAYREDDQLRSVMSANHQDLEAHEVPREDHEVKAVLWKRPATWIGSIVAAAILAIATAIGTSIGQKLSSAAEEISANASSPVVIEAVDLMPTFDDYSYVIGRKLVLTAPQLTEMNRQVGTS